MAAIILSVLLFPLPVATATCNTAVAAVVIAVAVVLLLWPNSAIVATCATAYYFCKHFHIAQYANFITLIH